MLLGRLTQMRWKGHVICLVRWAMHTKFQLGNMKLKDHWGHLMCILQSKLSFDVKIKYAIKNTYKKEKMFHSVHQNLLPLQYKSPASFSAGMLLHQSYHTAFLCSEVWFTFLILTFFKITGWTERHNITSLIHFTQKFCLCKLTVLFITVIKNWKWFNICPLIHLLIY